MWNSSSNLAHQHCRQQNPFKDQEVSAQSIGLVVLIRDLEGARLGDSPGKHPGDRHEMGNKIRDRVGKDRPGYNHWFNDDFWYRHHNRPPYYHHHNPHYWWRWATVGGSIGAWIGWNAAPIDYDYDYEVYFLEEAEYYGTPQGYIQQTEEIETAAHEATSDGWMPLGVRARTTISSLTL